MNKDAELIKSIKRSVRKWRKILQIPRYWVISTEFVDDESLQVYAQIMTEAPYSQSCIQYNMHNMRQLDGVNTVDKITLHELVHVLLSPLDVVLKKNIDEITTAAVEGVVENLTRVLLELSK